MSVYTKRLANILLVEDAVEDIVYIEAILKRANVRVNLESVRDGNDALSYLQKEGEYEDKHTPNLILLDLSMPQMSGLEVLAYMKDNPVFCKIPVAICSGSDAEKDILNGKKLGAMSYIVKPFTMTKFQEVLNSLSNIKIVEEDGIKYITC